MTDFPNNKLDLAKAICSMIWRDGGGSDDGCPLPTDELIAVCGDLLKAGWKGQLTGDAPMWDWVALGDRNDMMKDHGLTADQSAVLESALNNWYDPIISGERDKIDSEIDGRDDK